MGDGGWVRRGTSEVAHGAAEVSHLPLPAPRSPLPAPRMTRRRLLDLAALHRRRGREAQGAFLVEGVRSVEAALAAGAPLTDVVLADDAPPRALALADAARAAGVPVEVVGPREMARVSDAETAPGVVAVARRIVRDALPPGASRVVLLDGVQDPGNVGAAIRTAAWFGAEAVVADARSADPEGPKAVRAAMGGLWDVALVRVPDLAPVLDALAADGVAAWGADLGGVDVAAWAPGERSAVVLGSEAHGLSDAAGARLAGRVTIPPVTAADARGTGRGTESLNVTVAAGIVLHAWARGR